MGFIGSSKIKPVKNALFYIEKPFFTVGNVLGNNLSLFFNNFFHLVSLGKQNENLIHENLELQSQLSVLKEVQHENEVLKSEIGLKERGNNASKLLPANIVGRSSFGYIKTVIIDRGKKDGVQSGSGIISQGYLVGSIKEVYENTSEVNLITNYNSVIPVLLQESRGTGLLRGGIGGLAVEEIPLNVAVKKDEQVVTSGLGGDIPAGIPIGKVTGIVSKEGEVFQKVTVNSPIKIYFLEFVFVVQRG